MEAAQKSRKNVHFARRGPDSDFYFGGVENTEEVTNLNIYPCKMGMKITYFTELLWELT